MNYPKNRYSGPHPWTDKEWLYEEYIIKNRGVEEIAGDYGCAPSTIEKAASVHGLKRSPLPREKKTPPKPYEDKETLRRLYFDEGKNLTEIGKILGCSSDTIRVKMKGFEMPIKEFVIGKLNEVDLEELYINQKLSTTEIGKMYGVSNTTVRKNLQQRGIKTRTLSDSHFASLKKEKNSLLNNKEWLYNEYVIKKRSATEIGKELGGYALRTVQNALRGFDIHVRNDSESKIGLMIGEKHPNWKGGVTPFNLLCREYFEINLRPLVSERDGYTCQKCGKQHCRLHAHHIIPLSFIIRQIISEHPEIDINSPKGQTQMYNIVISDERFTNLDNIITYCKSCHIKEHKKYHFRGEKKAKMKIKIYVEESLEYYKNPVLLIASPSCTFKCCKEAGIDVKVCQNAPWALKPTYEIDNNMLIQLYENSRIMKGVVFAGLEPLDSFEETLGFIKEFREKTQDDVILYTGYKEEEVQNKISQLSQFPNIIVKFGRYIPNAPSRYDPVLGVTLASDNQYAKKIS